MGCGGGSFAETCLRLGVARYLGVDGSGPMVERARARIGEDDRARFVLSPIEDLVPDPAGFDLVTARMVLHYVADLHPVVDRLVTSLRPGGRLVFTVVHPVVTAAIETPVTDRPRQSVEVDDYFVPGPRRRRWFGRPVQWHHRTVEDHVSAVIAAGLTVNAVRECGPVEELFDGDDREYRRRRLVPVFLLVHGSRPPADRSTGN